MKVVSPPWNAGHQPPDDAQRLLQLFAASLIIHLLVMGFLFQSSLLPSADRSGDSELAVSFVDRKTQQPVVETLQEASEEIDPHARFESDRNLKAEQDTSPTEALTDVPVQGGMGDGQPVRQRLTTTPAQPTTVFSLSQADLVEEMRERENTLEGGGPQGLLPPGLMERVAKGEELKLSARESDYAQYILRMRQKLAQRWSPQRTVVPSMYQLRQVRVDVVVVLNDQGEIVELNTLAPSRFAQYDEEALRALRLASPFPNPHRSLVQDDGHVYLTWSFVLTMDAYGSRVVSAVE
jgi:TonB family protein